MDAAQKQKAGVALFALLMILQRRQILKILKSIRAFFSRQHYQQLYASPPLDWEQKEYFTNSTGLLIYYRVFPSIASKQRGVLIFLHGYAEHSGRYSRHFEDLNEMGFHVACLDHQGHGRSDGDRGHIPLVEDMVSDVCQLLDILDNDPAYDSLPKILFGHSFGGCLATLTVLRRPRYFAGLALSAPCFEPYDSININFLVLLVAMILPKLDVGWVDPQNCSHFPGNHWRTLFDPLHYNGGSNAHTAWQMIRGGRECISRAPEITIPCLLFGGKKEKLVNSALWETFINRLGSVPQEKEMEIQPDLLHEVLFESRTHPNQVEEAWDGLVRFLKTCIDRQHNAKSLMKKRSSTCLRSLDTEILTPLWRRAKMDNQTPQLPLSA